ncbi:DUF2515 domain-containing protein [Bacillota bacterium Lsc_1132]
MNHLTLQDKEIIRQIQRLTSKKNIDNISRTEAYFAYYKKNPEILWAFLASMVSRNGGWNMCDLKGGEFPQFLAPDTIKQLFLTYERANWLIFHDVFPQLLLYEFSTKLNRPMFHLLPYFNVSAFMQREWQRYWREHDQTRLVTSLIINEQNVIQKPVIEHPVYNSKVFQSWVFSFQDWLHFSSVLFPTCGGELYGASVNGFRKLSKRINLGRRLAMILFDQRLFPYFLEFAEKTPHTGSRYDYEHYFKIPNKRRGTPFLRTAFPIIQHQRHQYEDWSLTRRVSISWFFPVRHRHPIHLTDWYLAKKDQLDAMLIAKRLLHIKKKW